MSNVTFYCNDELYAAFKQDCEQRGITASSRLTQLIAESLGQQTPDPVNGRIRFSKEEE